MVSILGSGLIRVVETSLDVEDAIFCKVFRILKTVARGELRISPLNTVFNITLVHSPDLDIPALLRQYGVEVKKL